MQWPVSYVLSVYIEKSNIDIPEDLIYSLQMTDH